MSLFKHASERPPKSYDRIDGYTGIEHSSDSKPPKGGVPVQRDKAESDSNAGNKRSATHGESTPPATARP